MIKKDQQTPKTNKQTNKQKMDKTTPTDIQLSKSEKT